ncbi:protein BRICK 1-like [Malania oleifera]|uniref:protein BRICK 1-like n=1 Tax=Malania oleifera TaxID=397392 RepID=UPI0025AEA64E|nr:protein BRICK 1-like [Malania oleifera]
MLTLPSFLLFNFFSYLKPLSLSLSAAKQMARAGGITNAVNVGIAVQADWENREFISHISLNVRRLFDFLVQFEATTKSKLASLNEKLDTLERRLELLEVQVTTASANPFLFT